MPCVVHETPEERAEAARRNTAAITGPLHEEIDTLKAELAEREAMLCAVLTCIEAEGTGPDIIAHLDEKEAGVSAALIEDWFMAHKRKDEERRAREAAELEAKRFKALKKLTFEERILLGLPGKVG